MRIARDEIFGPVLTVIPFGSEQEAIRLANDTDYGLAFGIHTLNLKRAHRVARALRAGTVWVNTYNMFDATTPRSWLQVVGVRPRRRTGSHGELHAVQVGLDRPVLTATHKPHSHSARRKVMKVLVTGATGYLGAVAAEALAARGHQVLGLARSERSANALRKRGIEPVMGDFGDPVSLANAVHEARPDVVVSTASVGGASGDQAAFARDGEAVRAIREALADHGGALVFTSGSAVFGVFNGGDATDTVYDEDTHLPLPASVFAPASAGVHPLLAAGFGAAMAARVETERAVLADGDVRGVVVRPGLVYGRGGNSDLRSLIDRARQEGRAGHWGSGGTTQSYVHVEDLAELFCLAAELAPHGAILHGVAADVTQRDLARAINRMIGTDQRTDSLSLLQMLGIDADTVGNIGGSFTPPPSAASGISLSLNKRLSSDNTRKLLDWSPRRTDIGDDIAFGSYANT